MLDTGGGGLRADSAGASQTYDPLGRLAFTYHLFASPPSSGTSLLSDGQRVVAEMEGSTLLRRYVFGPGIDEPIVRYEGSGLSDRRWLHADERGSVIAISNGSGTVTNINSYDEQGIPASGNSGRFQYTGQQWISEFGMYHYRARTYSPTLGRFLQTDPIGFGGGMNIYAYVFNDPVNFIDPSGLGPDDPPCTNCGGDDILVTGPGGGPEWIPIGTHRGWQPRMISEGTNAGGGQENTVPCRPQPRDRFDDARAAAAAGARFGYNDWRAGEQGDIRERSVRVGTSGGAYSFDGLRYGPANGGPIEHLYGPNDSGASHVHTLTIGWLSRQDRGAIEGMREVLGADTYFGLADRNGDIRTWGPGEDLRGPGTPHTVRCP